MNLLPCAAKIAIRSNLTEMFLEEILLKNAFLPKISHKDISKIIKKEPNSLC